MSNLKQSFNQSGVFFIQNRCRYGSLQFLLLTASTILLVSRHSYSNVRKSKSIKLNRVLRLIKFGSRTKSNTELCVVHFRTKQIEPNRTQFIMIQVPHLYKGLNWLASFSVELHYCRERKEINVSRQQGNLFQKLSSVGFSFLLFYLQYDA